MEEQSTSSVLQNNLRTIFDLCDQDRDGVIAVQDFERIGRDHFENAQVSRGDRLGWAWWYKKKTARRVVSGCPITNVTCACATGLHPNTYMYTVCVRPVLSIMRRAGQGDGKSPLSAIAHIVITHKKL